ncbi:MAG: agmatine deiminase family protein [Muribaculaceae bacterium]|nr:agmatine deiminase family protein [Muribaculaceae bacterium]
MKDIRLLPEWEDVQGILVAFPHKDTDWNYILREAERQYIDLISAFTANMMHVVVLCHDRKYVGKLLQDCDSDYFSLVEISYNDTWTRDYGFISVVRGERRRALDFGFNGWGLKFRSDFDNLVNLRLHELQLLRKEKYRNERDFILEGGSIETDGNGTLLTTSRCLCSPNRNGGKSKEELNKILESRLGCDHVLWLDYGALDGDDTDSHIDTLARMAPNDVILFTGCRDMDDSHFEELLKMRAQLTLFRTKMGNPYNLIELPLPNPIFDEEGNRLPATYANYLVSDNVLFMTNYAQPENDMLAQHTLHVAFPEHKIVGVDCRVLIKQHGSLHCATMQIPKGYMNPVIFE